MSRRRPDSRVGTAQRTQVKRHTIVQPFLGPAIPKGDLADDILEPARPLLTELRNIYILRAVAKIARQHQRGAAIDRNVEPRIGGDCSAPDFIERFEELLAIEF